MKRTCGISAHCCLFTSVCRVFCTSAVSYSLPSNMGEASVISFCWWLDGYPSVLAGVQGTSLLSI